MNDPRHDVNPDSDTAPDSLAPVSLPDAGCIPLPPCAQCGADLCDHERESPGFLTLDHPTLGRLDANALAPKGVRR